MKDPMLEEFAASHIGNQIIVWPSLERLASAMAALQLEDEDLMVVSYELRTLPPCPTQWEVDSSKTHTKQSYPPGLRLVDRTVGAGPSDSLLVDTTTT